ncbi:MAG TPA: HlyD family efflux transporter periplasmic adaptor subunit [Xanthomonadaceae bacterium]|nr:HlyD family efflux transporter periplasmic adaptor subunit [Xanthomonadaceae bacterium]
MKIRFVPVGLLSASLLSLLLTACAKPAEADVPTTRPTDAAAVARGRVDVEGGLLSISSIRDGTVTTVNANDGDRVKQGDLLVQLDRRPAEMGVAVAQAELEQSSAQAAVLAARLPPLEQQSRRLTAAASDGAATGQSADDARNAVTVLKAELTAARAGVGIARQHLAAAQFERAQMSINAPFAGRIVARNVQVGDRVAAQSGKELIRVLPDRPLIVRVELGEAFVDAVHPGMRAEVIADANPKMSLTAHVLRVGQVFGVAGRSDDPQQSPDARVVECVLALDSGSLRVGQQVLVRIYRP